MSTVSQAKPARARNRAAVMLPSDSQVPTDGLPSRRVRFTGFGRINTSTGFESPDTRTQRSIFSLCLGVLVVHFFFNASCQIGPYASLSNGGQPVANWPSSLCFARISAVQ